MGDALPHIALIRHGETEWSRSGRHTGRTDVPLTDHGREQALSVGRRLKDRTFIRVFSSPLQRATCTAQLAGFGALLEFDPDLLEWNYGDYEGRRRAEIHVERPGWNVFRDGCPNGESLSDVSERADRVVARLRKADGDLALFSHAHFLRVLTARWLGLDPLAARALVVHPVGVAVLGYEHGSREEPVLVRWNEECSVPLWHS
jgi:broad specificity phosphatase PhoE